MMRPRHAKPPRHLGSASTSLSIRTAAEAGSQDAGDKFSRAERLLRRGVTKGVMHTRTASRTISRLHKLVHSSPSA